MRAKYTAVVAAAGVSALLLAPVAASATDGSSGRDRNRLKAVGLGNGGATIYRFSTDSPDNVRRVGDVRGLVDGDTRLVGIDYRVQDGNLYGVGNNGGIYLVSSWSGSATFVQRLTVALEGTTFGVDFNPAANALRVISDTGQNLRQPFAVAGTPTVADARLTSPPAAGDTLGVTAAAYTNNDKDPATATTLFDINTTTDAVVIQSPANAGTLVPTGSLGVDAAADAGFDIYSTVRKDTAVDMLAFASLSVNGQRGLYKINLLNGRAFYAGSLGGSITDLAFPLGQL